MRKRSMKFGKKALVVGFVIAVILIIFTMAMIYMGKDSSSLEILAGAGVSVLPILFGIYHHYNTKINLKHMEQNYVENYDEQNGIY